MSKVYYQLGHIYGWPVLIELNDGDRDAKAMVQEFMDAGGLPRYIAADRKLKARLFEKENIAFDMPAVTRKRKSKKRLCATCKEIVSPPHSHLRAASRGTIESKEARSAEGTDAL